MFASIGLNASRLWRHQREQLVAKAPNYRFNKQQRELAKNKRQQAKQEKKQARTGAAKPEGTTPEQGT